MMRAYQYIKPDTYTRATQRRTALTEIQKTVQTDLRHKRRIHESRGGPNLWLEVSQGSSEHSAKGKHASEACSYDVIPNHHAIYID